MLRARHLLHELRPQAAAIPHLHIAQAGAAEARPVRVLRQHVRVERVHRLERHAVRLDLAQQGSDITAAKPSYILAMKLNALERATIDDRDYEDAVNRSIECGVSSVDELREIFRRYLPDEDLPPRAALRLEEFASDIRAKLG